MGKRRGPAPAPLKQDPSATTTGLALHDLSGGYGWCATGSARKSAALRFAAHENRPTSAHQNGPTSVRGPNGPGSTIVDSVAKRAQGGLLNDNRGALVGARQLRAPTRCTVAHMRGSPSSQPWCQRARFGQGRVLAVLASVAPRDRPVEPGDPAELPAAPGGSARSLALRCARRPCSVAVDGQRVPPAGSSDSGGWVRSREHK